MPGIVYFLFSNIDNMLFHHWTGHYKLPSTDLFHITRNR